MRHLWSVARVRIQPGYLLWPRERAFIIRDNIRYVGGGTEQQNTMCVAVLLSQASVDLRESTGLGSPTFRWRVLKLPTPVALWCRWRCFRWCCRYSWWCCRCFRWCCRRNGGAASANGGTAPGVATAACGAAAAPGGAAIAPGGAAATAGGPWWWR